MQSMKLYCAYGSPATRAVFLCLEALGLKPERKVVNIMKGEQFNPDIIKMNPQHTVPILDDNGFIIHDSHTINAYLASKYGKDDSLYPKDLQKRAIINQRLHFDSGLLFPHFYQISCAVLLLGHKEIPEEDRNKVQQDYSYLEAFLKGQDYIAGNNFTIADFSCVASVSTLVEALSIEVGLEHPRVKDWLQRCKETLPGYSAAQDKGLIFYKSAIQNMLKINSST